MLMIAFWVILYFLGAFLNAETNIKLWSIESRGMITFIAGITALASILITFNKELK